MRKIFPLICRISAGIVLAVTPIAGKVFAAAEKIEEQPIGVGVSIGAITGGKSYTFSQYVRAIYAFSMKAAVALATLMMVYAGYKYLTSRGDSGAINEAKDILFSTLMGAALLMLVVLVAKIAGLDISILT